MDMMVDYCVDDWWTSVWCGAVLSGMGPPWLVFPAVDDDHLLEAFHDFQVKLIPTL